MRQNLPEGTADTAAPGGRKRCRVKSAAAHIDLIAPLCNAVCLTQGLRLVHASDGAAKKEKIFLHGLHAPIPAVPVIVMDVLVRHTA
jgi:hypothetical protein